MVVKMINMVNCIICAFTTVNKCNCMIKELSYMDYLK